MTKNFRAIMEDVDSQSLSNSRQTPSAVLSELFHDLTKRTQNLTPYKFKSIL